jgi:hypothetical protein
MKKKRPKTRRVTDEELLPCMDYLHGDVVDGEFKAACQYEYARESISCAKPLNSYRVTRQHTPEKLYLRSNANSNLAVGSSELTGCSSGSVHHFRQRSWNELSEKERAVLLYGLPFSTTKVRPLLLGEVMFLTHYLDQLKEKRAPLANNLKRCIRSWN